MLNNDQIQCILLNMEKKEERIGIRVPAKLIKLGNQIAEDLGMTPSQVFRNSILSGIKKMEELAKSYTETNS